MNAGASHRPDGGTELKIAGVKKIAVLRANGVGDFVFALPALHALKDAYPEAELVLLGLPWHVDFLAGRPSPIDRVIPVPFAKGIREEEGVEEDEELIDRFHAAMRDEGFDLGIQMHGGGRFSNPFIFKTGPRFTIGLRTPDADAPDRWVPYVYFQPEILRFLEVVALVGATPLSLQPHLAVTERDKREALAVIDTGDAPIVALVPGAGDGRRRWPPEKFAALGDRLAREGARVVVPGVATERAIIGRLVRTMNEPVEDLCGRLSLGGLVGLLSQCNLVVGNDSGPLHLAAAVNTPTVGIYWCGNLINAGPVTRSAHRPVLSWRLECPTCGVNCIYSRCDHHDSFVTDITVEEVFTQAIDLLRTNERKRVVETGEDSCRSRA
jgi:ADP-heptose:LPS heptosyltransferase